MHKTDGKDYYKENAEMYRALEGAVIEQMAKKYKVTVPQLGNRFDLQLDTIVLPKTTHREYLIETQSLDFVISPEDMDTLKSIGQYTGWKGSFSD